MKAVVGGHVIEQEGVWLGCVSLEVNEGRVGAFQVPMDHGCDESFFLFWFDEPVFVCLDGTVTVGLDKPFPFWFKGCAGSALLHQFGLLAELARDDLFTFFF